MARLYGFIFIVAFLVTVGGIAFAVVRHTSRKDRRLAAQDRREDELLNRMHGHNLTDVDESREELRRHKKRLERDLDDLHNPDREDRYGGVDENR